MLEAEKSLKQSRIAHRGYNLYFPWVKEHWTSRGTPLDFKQHTYLVQVYEDQSDFIVYKKPAQSGLSERMLTEAIWLPDQFKENSIYFMPTAGMLTDLVQERVDEPINMSPYLRGVAGRVKRLLGKQADKTSLKRLSKGFVYFRGSNKANQITSISGDAIFVDELDRMVMENVPFFDKRLEHSARKWQRWASTPTIPDFGIDKLFKQSDQHQWWLTCKNCGEKQVLDFFKNVDVDQQIIACVNCKQQMIPWECEGQWIPANPGADIRGYQIPQLCSPRLDLKKVINQSKGISEAELQQFYNQVLGIAYEPKGAKITQEDLQGCIKEYTVPYKFEKDKKGNQVPVQNTFMGVDVGRALHYIVRTEKRVIAFGTKKNFTGSDSLEEVMREFQVRGCVVDALPETREAQKFAYLFPKRVKLSYYTGMAELKDVATYWKISDDKVNSDRTVGLDHVFAEVKTQALELPKNMDAEFQDHMKSTVRVKRESRTKEIKAEYVETSPDHYLHALNYSKLAVNIYNVAVPEVFLV